MTMSRLQLRQLGSARGCAGAADRTEPNRNHDRYRRIHRCRVRTVPGCSDTASAQESPIWETPVSGGSKADYGPLNGVSRHRINTDLIAQHWDDVLRLAGSLKLGLVQATSIMRTLQVGDRPTKLAQAVAEIGRVDKTIHILPSIYDESRRRRTLIQLNRGEDRHSLARVVFHGKRGELRQHYREGQEDQLGALGLVVNVIVLWNTIYMDAVIEQLRSEGYPLKPEGCRTALTTHVRSHQFPRSVCVCATRLRSRGPTTAFEECRRD
jgi:hypothetical protein